MTHTIQPTRKKNGNPWFITTLWMAQYDMHVGHTRRAAETLHWVNDRMLGTGVLPEQCNPKTYKFISAAPLTWSQAEFLSTLLDGSQKVNRHGYKPLTK